MKWYYKEKMNFDEIEKCLENKKFKYVFGAFTKLNNQNYTKGIFNRKNVVLLNELPKELMFPKGEDIYICRFCKAIHPFKKYDEIAKQKKISWILIFTNDELEKIDDEKQYLYFDIFNTVIYDLDSVIINYDAPRQESFLTACYDNKKELTKIFSKVSEKKYLKFQFKRLNENEKNKFQDNQKSIIEEYCNEFLEKNKNTIYFPDRSPEHVYYMNREESKKMNKEFNKIVIDNFKNDERFVITYSHLSSYSVNIVIKYEKIKGKAFFSKVELNYINIFTVGSFDGMYMLPVGTQLGGGYVFPTCAVTTPNTNEDEIDWSQIKQEVEFFVRNLKKQIQEIYDLVEEKDNIVISRDNLIRKRDCNE